jgi:hypothetical protein
MNESAWMRWPDSCSRNRKSEMQNRKWVGLVALVVTLAACGALAEAQQVTKVPLIGYLSNTDPA